MEPLRYLEEHNNIDLLVGLIERLPHEPRSLWRARQLGGEEFFGWSGDSTRLADLIDLTEFTARASAVNKAKPAQIAPRPQPKQEPEVRETTKVANVADLDWSDALEGFAS